METNYCGATIIVTAAIGASDLNASTKTVRQVLAFQLRGIMILYRSVDEGFQVVNAIKWNNQIYNVSILIILQIFHIYVCHTI